MKRACRRFSAAILAVVLLLGITVTASAEVPYNSYTYWSDVSSNNKAVYNRPMYKVCCTLSAAAIGVNEFSGIKNICSDGAGYIYILDSSSRIIVIDSSIKLVREIGLISGIESYDSAESIYVYTDGTLYICDTKGKRVIHATADGQLIEFITLPDSSLIPDDFSFNPVRITRDQYGYLYVLSKGSYYGALLYAPDHSFLGFYGANTVKGSISSTISNIQNRLFPNNEKKANTKQKLPYSFVDIDIDSEGFIYTCNGYTSASDRKGQIRKLSPGTGTNILKSDEVNFVDDAVNMTYKSGEMAKQNISEIAVDKDKFIYGLESVYGKIFLYDSQCNTLSVFGGGMGSGTQPGTFAMACGLALVADGEKVVVADSETSLITFFEITDFGRQVKNLSALTKKGEYDQVKSGWTDVLKKDANFQPAYAGLARVCLNQNDYENALKLAKKGYDRDTYEVAFKYQRKEFFDQNFTILFTLLILFVAGLVTWLVISKKKKWVLLKNKELHLMMTTPLRPANSFTLIKEKHLGSIALSAVLIVLFYIATVLQTICGGFLFTKYDLVSFNSLFVLARSAGLVILWIITNWMICTLLGGKGKLREIMIVTCYSLIPLIIEKFIRLILTNVLILSEASFLNILDTIAIIYFGFMIIIGLIKIHDFSMSRLLGTSVLSIAGIAAIVFLMIMLVILAQQFWGFIATVVTEIVSL